MTCPQNNEVRFSTNGGNVGNNVSRLDSVFYSKEIKMSSRLLLGLPVTSNLKLQTSTKEMASERTRESSME